MTLLPDFAIIGAQKSATTFLQVCLNEHPEVYLPPGEISFFRSPDYEQSDISDLEAIFAGKAGLCLGIKRADYLGTPEVPERINKHLPHAKLLVVLRNPVNRAISAYFHYIKYGFLPPVSIESGMRRIIADPDFSKRYRRAPEIIEFGRYFKYLRMYDSFVDNRQMQIFLFNELTARPHEFIKRAYRFLGVDPRFTPRSLQARPQRVIYNLTRLKFVTLRNRYLYDYNSQRTRLFVKQGSLAARAITKIISGVDRAVLAPLMRNRRPRISPDLRQVLFEQYVDDIKRLEIFIGLDLSAWQPKHADPG